MKCLQLCYKFKCPHCGIILNHIILAGHDHIPAGFIQFICNNQPLDSSGCNRTFIVRYPFEISAELKTFKIEGLEE